MSGPQILRSNDLRAENRHRVIRALRREGPLSRAKVGKITGLSQASLSNLLGIMSEEGIVTSQSRSGGANTRPGRPQTLVALSSEGGICITIALRVSTLIISVSDYSGKDLSRRDLPIDSATLDSKSLIKLLISAVKTEISDHPGKQLRAISLGFQGVTDSQTGELLWSPVFLADRVPISKKIQKQFDVQVSVNNDCALIATALHRSEKAKLGDSFAAVLFSHGIGMGAYLSGQPFYGAQSSALELGHIQFKKDGAMCRCGKHGCIEAYAADYGISRTATGSHASTTPVENISDEELQALIAAAIQGESAAVKAFKLAGQAIGSGLATFFNLFDPMPIALVGHDSEAIRLMSEDIQEALSSVSRRPVDYSSLLHSYNSEMPLLLEGLAMSALAIADRELANLADQAVPVH